MIFLILILLSTNVFANDGTSYIDKDGHLQFVETPEDMVKYRNKNCLDERIERQEFISKYQKEKICRLEDDIKESRKREDILNELAKHHDEEIEALTKAYL